MQQSAKASWGWAAILGFAMWIPIGLPAGGGSRGGGGLHYRQREDEPLLSPGMKPLHANPAHHERELAWIELASPMRVLRKWHNHNGTTWLQVESICSNGRRTRGWLEVGNSG